MPTFTLYSIEVNRPFSRFQRCHLCLRSTPVRHLASIFRPLTNKLRNPMALTVCQRCKPLRSNLAEE